MPAFCIRVEGAKCLAQIPELGPTYRRPETLQGLVRDFGAVHLGPVLQQQMPKIGLVALVAEIPRYRASSTLTMPMVHDFNVVAARSPQAAERRALIR